MLKFWGNVWRIKNITLLLTYVLDAQNKAEGTRNLFVRAKTLNEPKAPSPSALCASNTVEWWGFIILAHIIYCSPESRGRLCGIQSIVHMDRQRRN